MLWVPQCAPALDTLPGEVSSHQSVASHWLMRAEITCAQRS